MEELPDRLEHFTEEQKMMRFEDKNVLITGAASGIGKAVAERIIREGGNVALLDIDLIKLEEVAHHLEAYGKKIVTQRCDVADFDDTKKAINRVCQELKGIHSLSHNVGILRAYHTHEMTPAQWDELISVNLTGTFNVNRLALPHLLQNSCSYLVNTSSIASYYRHPWMSAYSATKGGIVSFTRSLFIEYYQQGLHANCVLPGAIETPLARSFKLPEGANPELLKALTPIGTPQFASPDNVAAAIAFLASDDAFYINGTELSVDGGKI